LCGPPEREKLTRAVDFEALHPSPGYHHDRHLGDSMSASGHLGRKIQHDPRSREHAFTAAGLPTRHVRHAMNAPHVDQFYLSACVGFSGTNMLNTAAGVRSRRRFNVVVPIGKAGSSYLGNDDGIRNYHEATLRDPYPWQYPPKDEGSSAIG